ncbi:hypothetical protein FACS1894179_04870 [Bacteroidia bacterium]|nr:hypothetical protein FACS1894179_04870 [Bacteroidia bacterium]
MIYEVTKGDVALTIDDNVLFEKQPKKFRDLFNETRDGDIADFDNCNVLVLYTDRIIITIKLEEDGTI